MDTCTLPNETEARIRTITADRLGVADDELQRTSSLLDDLAADSLDLAEVAAALEDAFGIALPDSVLENVRTFGDLVDTVLVATHIRRPSGDEPGVPPVRVVARLVPRSAASRALEWSGELTPYFAETIVEHASALGDGGRLEVVVATPRANDVLERIRARFAPLAAHGIAVRVQRVPVGTGPRRSPSAA